MAKKKPINPKPESGEKPATPPAKNGFAEALKPPPGGAAIRMYRIGHGDCFLIAFEGKSANKPAYVMISTLR